METIFDHSVSELPVGQKQSLEAVLGRQLEAHQRILIRVSDPSEVPDEAARQAAMQGIERTLAATNRRASLLGITAEEADAAVEEAMAHVRRRPPA